jgi:hypothetical protein
MFKKNGAFATGERNNIIIIIIIIIITITNKSLLVWVPVHRTACTYGGCTTVQRM